MKKTILAVFLLFLHIPFFSQVNFDSDFGNGGQLYSNFFNQNNKLYNLLLQNDGKILATGSRDSYMSSFQEDFLTVRYLNDGTKDPDFGNEGIVVTPNGARSTATCIAVQEDGKIVVAGRTEQQYTELMVVRYNTDGTLDGSFANSGKIVLPHDGVEYPSVALVQQDGKIIVAGHILITSPKQMLVRLNPNGSVDNTFGVNGYVILNDGVIGKINDIKITSDGKITAAGTLNNEFLIRRFNSNGSVDITFGNGGSTTTQIAYQDEINHFIFLEDNSIIAVGVSKLNGNSLKKNSVIVKYLPTGWRDLQFGTNGIVLKDFGQGKNTYAADVAVDADNNILVGFGCINTSPHFFSIGSYNLNGTINTGFGNNGFHTLIFEQGWSELRKLKLDSEGRILIAGSRILFLDEADSFFLARFEYNVLNDRTFNREQKETYFSPNPISTDSGIHMNLRQNSNLTFQFFDARGMLLSSHSGHYLKGDVYEKFPFLQTLPEGIYLLKLSIGNQEIKSIKIVK